MAEHKDPRLFGPQTYLDHLHSSRNSPEKMIQRLVEHSPEEATCKRVGRVVTWSGTKETCGTIRGKEGHSGHRDSMPGTRDPHWEDKAARLTVRLLQENRYTQCLLK